MDGLLHAKPRNVHLPMGHWAQSERVANGAAIRLVCSISPRPPLTVHRLVLSDFTHALRLLIANLNRRDPVAAGDASGDFLASRFDFLCRLDRIIGMFRARDRDGLGDEALSASQVGVAGVLLMGLAQEAVGKLLGSAATMPVSASAARATDRWSRNARTLPA